MERVKGIVVAGLSGGSGKSVVAVGLTALLAKEYKVVPFKKGPDYIDAGWLTQAAGSPCYNLDPYLMSDETLLCSFQNHAAEADFVIVEGNRGLYDGVNSEGGFSTAELAKQLDLPVLLVVNCTKTTRTVAAMVLGCRELDPRLKIAGVVLNQIATKRQEKVIRESVQKYTGIPVIGIVPRQKQDIFPMRHLGITPHQESNEVAGAVNDLAELIEQHCDKDRLVEIMQEVSVQSGSNEQKLAPEPEVTIGILRDRAFQFYYEENLEALKQAGARLTMIDALSADKLPDNIDALYIGGGFPETSAGELAANVSFRNSVRQKAEEGLPIYAECGGLIFLGQSIILDGKEYPLTGVFPVTFGIAEKPQAHGYSIFTVQKKNPFYPIGTTIKGHEFRYSTVLQWEGRPEELTLKIERGTGFVHCRDGLLKKNTLALYTHVLAPATPEWAKGVVNAALRTKQIP